MSSLPNSYSTPTPSAEFTYAAMKALDTAKILYRVRDEVMNRTPEGQRLISLYYTYAPKIAERMFADEALYKQGFDLVDLFIPNLSALANDKGDTATITEDQVKEVQAFLDDLAAGGNTEIQDVIQSESKRHPLETMIGMSMDQAWRYVNGYRLKWLPPISDEDSYTGQQGRVIPMKFTVTDFEGNFVVDETLTLQVLDSNGRVVIGPVQVSDNTNNDLKIQGNQYHYNLQTKDLPAGSYILQVAYNSSNGAQSETRSIILTRRK